MNWYFIFLSRIYIIENISLKWYLMKLSWLDTKKEKEKNKRKNIWDGILDYENFFLERIGVRKGTVRF